MQQNIWSKFSYTRCRLRTVAILKQWTFPLQNWFWPVLHGLRKEVKIKWFLDNFAVWHIYMSQIVKIGCLLKKFCDPVFKVKLTRKPNFAFKLFLKWISNNLMIRKYKIFLYIVKLVHNIFFFIHKMVLIDPHHTSLLSSHVSTIRKEGIRLHTWTRWE